MKRWILSAAALLLMQNVHSDESEALICAKAKVECSKKKCETPCPKPDPCCPPVCFERGHELDKSCVPSAYSEPAGIRVRCGYDVIATASFLYWEAMQEGMDLAIPWQAIIVDGALIEAQRSVLGLPILVQETEFKPGFQLGLGWSGLKDDWVLFAEYTYLHGNTHTSSHAPKPDVASIGGVPILPDGIYLPTSWFAGSHFGNFRMASISSEWQYKIDVVDAQISRPFYSGTRFSVEPFFGLRGAWIRQEMTLTAPILPFDEGPLGAYWRAHYSSQSSAVGPRVGINGNWHLGCGLRFIGDAAASVLFTSYDVKQNVASPDIGSVGLKTKYEDLNLLRPNLDLSLGLGWGSYFFCRQVHWDLSATYDFSVFWGQNMMRALADLTADDDAWPSASVGDLYLQGLTLSTRFDF